MSFARAVSTERPVPSAASAALDDAWRREAALRVGMWLAVAAISMLFLAFTSAYIVRQGVDPQWRWIPMPPLVPANTAVLVLSSASVEMARRSRNPRPWLLVTLGGGLLFLCGQLAVWRALRAGGQGFAATAHASFFYTLTAVHGMHLLGGLLALAWTAAAQDARRRWVGAAALYWHFMGALWLYLVWLLFFDR